MKKKFQHFGIGAQVPPAQKLNKADLGGKGHRLALDTKAGLRVAPGFTVPTYWCKTYLGKQHASDRVEFLEDFVDNELMPAIDELRQRDLGRPFVLSVRSGSPISMPGMMDTLLNIGLGTKDGARLQDAREFLGDIPALDSMWRLVRGVGSTVCGHDPKGYPGVEPLGLGVEYYEERAKAALKHWASLEGVPFPTDLRQQLLVSVRTVWESWNSERAVAYRAHHKIADDLFTAVNVQVMRFGNLDDESCTGVVFTRNPTTGEPGLWGEFLPRAQGEDVVDGSHDPRPIADMESWSPDLYAELCAYGVKLEAFHGDMQDIEFTVESGALWHFQSRNGKREATAAFRIAYDLIPEIGIGHALQLVAAEQYHALAVERIDEAVATPPWVKGLPACSGVARGTVATSNESAAELAAHGHTVILVREETSPDDLPGMLDAAGFLTAKGGMTAHAAVVGRDLNKPVIVAAGPDILSLQDGEQVSICGTSGRVWKGSVPVLPPMADPFADEIINRAMAEAGMLQAIHAAELPGTEHDYLDLHIKTNGASPKDFGDLVAFLNARPDAGGVIDLRPAETFPEDDALWSLTGPAGAPEPMPLDLKVTYLAEHLTDEGRAGFRVIVPADAATLPKPAGMEKVTIVDSLAELLDADGAVGISDSFAASLGPSAAKLSTKFKGAVVDTQGFAPGYAAFTLLGGAS